MTIVYVDAISGAAGGMILGAFLDAGLSLDDLRTELARLPLTGYDLRVERVQKRHISASQFRVHVAQEDHHHGPDGHAHGRSLGEIEALIAGSELNDTVKGPALRIFRRLGQAEAKIHGVPIEQVHFHEVGAIDSVIDIVGACAALQLLGVERVYCSPLPLGSGTVETQHGVYPIPAPATLEILASAGAPTISGAQHAEQVTPTGAAILTTVATFQQPPMTVERVGYGAGEADLSIPNVLRVWIGRPSTATREEVAVLETNIDDMNPQLYEHVLERLFEAGALDALLVPVIMKKGRPGIKLEVLCKPADQQALAEVLLRETSTLGVRLRSANRLVVERETRTVSTPHGEIRMKIKRSGGRAIAAVPEYEDCRRLASTIGVPLIEVYHAALAAGRSLLAE